MWTFLANVGTIATILGVSFLSAVDNATKAWISIAAVLCFLAFLTWRGFLVSRKFLLLSYPKGYQPISCALRLTTSNGKNFIYDQLRHIQIKVPAKSQFKDEFYWTGTKEPQVFSDLQKVSPVTQVPGQHTRYFTLRFPHTKIYNDVEILHSRMEIDDSDEKSEPFLALRVVSNIQLISYRVEFLHAQASYYGEKAMVTRKPFDQGPASVEEQILTVDFDSNTKSFSHQIPNPEPGYEYFLKWNRPALQNGSRPKGKQPRG